MSAKKPNLFVVGAPRAGTTRLYEVFNKHPEIDVAKRKEPYYFSEEATDPNWSGLLDPVTDEGDYLALFDGKGRYACETSTTYCWDATSPRRIATHCPEAKIIFTLRHPVERLFSHYLLHASRYGERRSLEKILETFENGPRDVITRHLILSGMYHENLMRYYALFPRENILVMDFASINRYPLKAAEYLTNFLGIPFESELFVASGRVNQNHARRNRLVAALHEFRNKVYPKALPIPEGLKKLYQSKVLEPELKSSTERQIYALYEEDQIQLLSLIGWNHL